MAHALSRSSFAACAGVAGLFLVGLFSLPPSATLHSVALGRRLVEGKHVNPEGGKTNATYGRCGPIRGRMPWAQ